MYDAIVKLSIIRVFTNFKGETRRDMRIKSVRLTQDKTKFWASLVTYSTNRKKERKEARKLVNNGN